MDKIAKFYVCNSKDHVFGIVVTQDNGVYLDKITPKQLKNGTAEADVVANGADLFSSDILDDVIETLKTPVPSTPCEEKKEPEEVAA